MSLGANEKTKIFGMDPKVGRIVLSALGLVAAYMLYSNVFSGPSYPTAPPASNGRAGGRAAAPDGEPDAGRSGAPAAGAPAQATAPDSRRANPSARPKGEEFHPALRSKRKEDQIDPFSVDPTLRLDLLAKVMDVKPDGGQRNLFQFGAIQPVETSKLTGPETVIKPVLRYGPFPLKPPEPKPVVAETPPPPIPYKYYGLSTKRIDGKKTAFFLDGEEIIFATEGMTVKKRYKLMRINANSVVVLETESKKEQTVQISEDAGGNIS
jgi:hypothetical protein